MTTLSKISKFEENVISKCFKSVVMSDVSVCLLMVYTACLFRLYYIYNIYQGHTYFYDIDIPQI